MGNQNAYNLPIVKFNPFTQGAVIISLTAIALLVAASSSSSSYIIWSTTCTGILFFAIVNPILSVFQIRWLPYFLKSILAMAMISISLIMVSKWTAGESILSDRTFAMTFIASAIFFFMASALAFLVKSIYAFATESL